MPQLLRASKFAAMLSRTFCFLFVSLLPLFLPTESRQPNYIVTQDDINTILSRLHPEWPPTSFPPPSNLRGLTMDKCNGSAECVPPRLCLNCPDPPCSCVKPPPNPNITCASSSDCDDGEFCLWHLSVALKSGLCVSSFHFGRSNTTYPVLHQPIDSVPPQHAYGRTGDRCFSHDDCVGTRSCLSESSLQLKTGNISTCELSRFPCVCTPLQYAQCQSSSECEQLNETCSSVSFLPSWTLSSRSQKSNKKIRLSSICVSSRLTENENVLPMSTLSSNASYSDPNVAEIRLKSPVPSMLFMPPQRTELDVPPFSVPGLSVFNTFSTNELGNEFIGGILSLIIASQLHKILRGLVYTFPGIHQNGYSSFIIYSRLSSFRNFFRLFTGREPFLKHGKPAPRQRLFGLDYKLAFFPFFAFVFLLGAETSTIMAGTNTRVEHFADQNFDPIISAPNGTPRPRVQDSANPHCDDFFVPTRGIMEFGKVLKCVKRIFISPSSELHNSLQVHLYYGSGKTVFKVYSQDGGFAAVDLSTSVRSISGVNMKTMPFRPDLMNEQERTKFLNGILNAISSKLGYRAIDTRRNLWSTKPYRGSEGQLESMELAHRPTWNDSVQTIANAVILGLRDLDLVLNSSSEPWVYIKPYTFERWKPLMAILKPYRICHGWLLLVACLVTAIHVIGNSWITSFEDVAYVAMKELLEEDCIVGPLVESNANKRDFHLAEPLGSEQDGRV